MFGRSFHQRRAIHSLGFAPQAVLALGFSDEAPVIRLVGGAGCHKPRCSKTVLCGALFKVARQLNTCTAIGRKPGDVSAGSVPFPAGKKSLSSAVETVHAEKPSASCKYINADPT